MRDGSSVRIYGIVRKLVQVVLGKSGAIKLSLLLSDTHHHQQCFRVRANRANFSAQTREKLKVPDIEFKIDNTTIQATAVRNRATLMMKTREAAGFSAQVKGAVTHATGSARIVVGVGFRVRVRVRIMVSVSVRV